ncbi:thyrotropin releasing hormone [Nannospalax galili]|uniref:thyrotropin releasing hormone n=1 Tax=Nannospalax galili TaxID=1026970 RepID=UPI0004ED5956|nr:thyrotropin releasing hormone [Nannospalax galili]
MPGPWSLFSLALILTLTRVPGSGALPEAVQEESVAAAELPSLSRGELGSWPKDLQRVRGDLGAALESLLNHPNSRLIKRQHPGKREEAANAGAEEEMDLDLGEAGAWGLHKQQHPGRREDRLWLHKDDSWAPNSWSPDGWISDPWSSDIDMVQPKRQHPGRRSYPWVESDIAKRQHPGRRLVEETEEEGEGALMLEKRQHPGRRASADPCGPQGTCGQAGLLGLLGDLSRVQEALEKQRPEEAV